MKTVIWKDLSEAGRIAALARPARRSDPALVETVRRILDDIEARGPGAVAEWSVRLDGKAPEKIALDAVAVDRARSKLSCDDLSALEFAAENIRRYHVQTKPKDQTVSFDFGLECRRVYRAVPSCGLYVPGGSAPLFAALRRCGSSAGRRRSARSPLAR